MQLLTAERDDLLKPLLMGSGIVERRHTMPILANVLISRNGSNVTFTTTDLEVQIQSETQIDNAEPIEASVTVNIRKLLDILRALPSSGAVNFVLDGSRLNIQSGRSRFVLQTVEAEAFPKLKELQDVVHEFTVSSNRLKHLINMTHYAMAHQDIRYYLNGTLLALEGNVLHVVATDAHRLAHHATEVTPVEVVQTETLGELNAGPAPAEIILPRKTILELQRMLPDSDEIIRVQIGLGQIRFLFGSVELISKLVEGKFPEYKRVIDVQHEHHFEMDRERLLASLVRVAIVNAHEKLRSAKIQIQNNQMSVSTFNSEQENAQEELEVDYAHELVDLGLNVTYLQEFLQNAKSQTVRWSVSPQMNTPLLLGVPGEDSFQYIVMPMRI